MDHLQTGAERAGRTVDDLEVGMMVVAAVDDSKEAARDYLRPLLAVYLARLPDITKRTSVWGEDGEGWRQLVEAVDSGGGEVGKQYITDEIVDETALGRELRFPDERPVQLILKSLKQHGYGAKVLVHEIVLSEPFRYKMDPGTADIVNARRKSL